MLLLSNFKKHLVRLCGHMWTIHVYINFSVSIPTRLQCCGLKVGQAPSSAVPQPQEVCGSPGVIDKRGTTVSIKRPLSPLLSLSDSPGPPDTMLAQRRTTTTTDPRTANMENGLSSKLNNNKSPAGAKSASIRDKISQWEGKKEPAPATITETCPLSSTQKEVETVRKKESKASEVQRADSKRFVSWDRQDSGKENVGKLGTKSPEGPTNKDREVILERGFRASKPTEQPKDKKTVLTHVKKLEKATMEVPDRPSLAFPGNYFCPPSKEELEENEKRANEPIFGTFDLTRPSGSWRRREGDSENVYSEPGAPSINPLPKPQRTFQHHTPPTTPTSGPSSGKGKRNLPPLPSIPPPPLPTCPPPGVCRRPWADKARDSSNR